MAEKYTFQQFQSEYPDDDACLDAILGQRYGALEACPNCGVTGRLSRIAGRRAYACKAGCHIYPCAGTIFEHSSTKLSLWFHAMYLMTATRNGVSAKELQRQLGVTYKCAWRMGHQLRALMAQSGSGSGPMGGHVEIDETYVGGKEKGRGRKDNKSVVMGIVERGGNFKGKVIEKATRRTLIPIIKKHVNPGAIISTDTLAAYQILHSLGFKHGAVNHGENEWARGIHCTNRIEGFWSHLKRGIRSTHASVSRKHLQNYVDEFAFRYNNRKQPAIMFLRLLCLLSLPRKAAP